MESELNVLKKHLDRQQEQLPFQCNAYLVILQHKIVSMFSKCSPVKIMYVMMGPTGD